MDGWQRLAHLVAAERGRRWKSRAAFSRASGVSTRVIDDLETGGRSNYSEATLGAIEAALGWESGTCLEVVQGRKVRREVDPQLSRLLDAWQQLSPDARALLVEISERVVRERPF